MKTILHMSVSADGFIAKPNGDSNWVSKIDCDLFEKRCLEIGCLIVGRKTFEQFQGSLYPIKGICNIVLSQSIKSQDKAGVFFVDSPDKALKLAEERGFKQVLLAGGGHLAGSFLKSSLVSEIFLSVHPLILNKGIKLFEGFDSAVKLDLLSQREMGEGLVELHYKVVY